MVTKERNDVIGVELDPAAPVIRTIHGDIKPRNIIRAKGDLKLIDLDAAVEEGGSLTEKFSGGFLPPSIAREKFKPKETLDEVTRNGAS